MFGDLRQYVAVAGELTGLADSAAAGRLSAADETEAIRAANAGLARIEGDLDYDAAEVAAATAASGALILIAASA